jgi:hypothetical protein
MAYIFIILEYIFLPLIAILASFASKKKLKRTTLSLEEFLEDLNIDIKIICTLGLILYALSMAAHGKGQSNSAFFNNYCWTGIVVGLIGYINIHHSYKFGTISVVNTRVKFFGVYNSLYKDSSWYAIGLILYVVVGLLLHYILDPSDAQNQSSAWIISGYIIISLASIYLCTVFFFFLLNKQAKVYLIKENAHINAYSDAYS